MLSGCRHGRPATIQVFFRGLGFRVWGLGHVVLVQGFTTQGLEIRVQGCASEEDNLGRQQKATRRVLQWTSK